MTDETQRGLECFKGIIEGGKVLTLQPPHAVHQGMRFALRVTGLGKEWQFSLSREQIDDLAGTVTHHAPALALARSLDKRFMNVDPNIFVTQERRLVHIEIEWPALPLVSPNGGWTTASGVWATIQDVTTQEIGKCIVKLPTMLFAGENGSDPYSRPKQIVNAIRAGLDAGTIPLYPTREDLIGKSHTPIQCSLSGYGERTLTVAEYVAWKVWLLAFQAGNGAKQNKTWIADPWDADYLGCTVAELKRTAAVVEAQALIVLDEESEFAHVGTALLASNGPVSSTVTPASTKPVFQTTLSTYTPKQNKPLGEGGSGRVLLVSDANGDDFALKYLKPEVRSEQKSKRFKNELNFCSKNTHPNIITIEDHGLTTISGTQVPFFVMPAYPETLRTLMAAHTSTDKLLLLFADVCNAVEYAHGASPAIWHRDLKPENILATADGSTAVVTDFGVAHFDDEYLHTLVQTAPGDRLANFRYAAPEQKEQAQAADQRADIYALGLILYEIFTGQLLQGTQHKKISSIDPRFGFLDFIVESMTCQSPDDRTSSMALVREMLVLNSPPDLSAMLLQRFDIKTTSIKFSPKQPALADARYEKKGTPHKLDTFVRRHESEAGMYTFHTSDGEVFHGTEEQVADRFVAADRRLQQAGYDRGGWGNRGGKPLFNLA